MRSHSVTSLLRCASLCEATLWLCDANAKPLRWFWDALRQPSHPAGRNSGGVNGGNSVKTREVPRAILRRQPSMSDKPKKPKKARKSAAAASSGSSVPAPAPAPGAPATETREARILAHSACALTTQNALPIVVRNCCTPDLQISRGSSRWCRPNSTLRQRRRHQRCGCPVSRIPALPVTVPGASTEIPEARRQASASA